MLSNCMTSRYTQQRDFISQKVIFRYSILKYGILRLHKVLHLQTLYSFRYSFFEKHPNKAQRGFD